MTSPGAFGKVLEDWHSGEVYQRQTNEILKHAGDDPRGAIGTAATLPVQSGQAVPRSETPLRIAQVEWKKNPSASKEALEQMADSLKKVDPANCWWARSPQALTRRQVSSQIAFAASNA